MSKVIKILILIIALGIISFFGVNLWQELPELKKDVPALVREIQEQIVTPPPLIFEERVPESFLTQAGVINWTNIQREKYGLPALKENSKLNSSALVKAQDMLSKQYFEHISPSGQGISDLANQVGYEFIAIGENLALGDFEDDERLVGGWMSSPGHRANILSSKYQEIGVAILKGEFEGRTTWLAVQHFGKPLAACPQLDEVLLATIETNQSQIEQLSNALSALQQEIKTMRPKRGFAYSQKVEEYNNLVSEYNSLIETNKLLIEQYNREVRLFNECASSS